MAHGPGEPPLRELFGGLIRSLGARYDGHPHLEAVDVAIIGYWGEGSGAHLLRDGTRKALLSAYLDAFERTPLIFQPLNGDAPDPAFLVRGLPIAARLARRHRQRNRPSACVTWAGASTAWATWASGRTGYPTGPT